VTVWHRVSQCDI